MQTHIYLANLDCAATVRLVCSIRPCMVEAGLTPPSADAPGVQPEVDGCVAAAAVAAELLLLLLGGGLSPAICILLLPF